MSLSVSRCVFQSPAFYVVHKLYGGTRSAVHHILPAAGVYGFLWVFSLGGD